MDSKDLDDAGFGNWTSLTTENSSEVISSLPQAPAVYIIRANDQIPRSNGATDIVRFGKATDLRSRVRSHFGEESTKSPGGRLQQWLGRPWENDIGWLIMPTANDVFNKDQELLDQYEDDHWENPQLNRKRG